MIYIIVGVLVIVFIYFLSIYNKLVKMDARVLEAFSTMDVYLKKRWDLIPNLVETVKGYAKHESETLEEIVKLRGSSYDGKSVDDKLDVNEKMTMNINRLIALKESYPELKANESFIKLSEDLTKCEEDIANSRKYYNGCVRKFNNIVMMFPSNIVASLFKFKVKKMFEALDDERKNVNVEL